MILYFSGTLSFFWKQYSTFTFFSKGIDKNTLLDIVVAGEKNSLHPIAVAICEYYPRPNKKLKVKDFMELVGKGIEYKVDGKTYFVGRAQSKVGSTLVVVKENGKDVIAIGC